MAKERAIKVTASENGNIVKRRRRRRKAQVLSLDAEIRNSAKEIYKSGLAEAMRAAALVIVARKLDELKLMLMASGLSSDGVPTAIPSAVPPPAVVRPAAPAAAPVANPCVQCGRAGIYKTKANPFNRTGSWYCRWHLALGGQIEAEDRGDRVLQMSAPPPPPSMQQPPMQPMQQPAPPMPPPEAGGATSLAEAMGMAELVSE